MPEPVASLPSVSREQFAAELVRFINEVLPRLYPRLPVSLQVDEQTPLFETGLIDSMAILDLIAFVEKDTGLPIPSRMVVMKHFRTVAAICESFGPRPETSS